MNFDDFQTLPREQQFAEASRIAGVPASTFDGMWRTESGRGVAMLSPAGAEGHFGLMPTTRKVIESRIGAKVDPYNFGQSLYAAAQVLGENVKRFKNLPDSLRAYNGGWDAKRWGNPETAAYAGKVLGGDFEPDTEQDASTFAALSGGLLERRAVHAAADLWNTPAGSNVAGKAPAAPSPIRAAAGALMASLTPTIGAPDFDPFAASQINLEGKQKAAQKLKDETSFYDATKAAMNSDVLMVAAKAILRDPEPADANFKLDPKLLEGKDKWEQRELQTVSSEKQLQRVLFDQSYQREQDATTFRNGSVFGIGAALLAGLPSGVVSGGLASLGFRGLGVGAYALAQGGSKGAALASSFGEGVVGNVLTTAALDAMGQHQGLEQYAFAVAGGALNPLLQGKGLGKMADAAAEAERGLAIYKAAVAQKEALFAKAEKNLPAGATPDDIAGEAKRLEAEGVRSEIASRTSAVPEERKLNAGQDAPEALPEGDGVAAPKAEAPAPAEPAPLQTREEIVREGGPLMNQPFEDPTYQAQRAIHAENNPAWAQQAKKMMDGELDLATARALPEGVHFTKAVSEDPTFGKMSKLIEEVAAEYLPNSRIVVGKGANAGANGSVMSVGDTHIIAIKDGKLDHSALHELGHAIYQQYAPSAPVELIKGIDKGWLEFAQQAKAGNPDAWVQRWAATNPVAKDLNAGAVPKPTGYNLAKNEYIAEQFVKHFQARLMAGQYGKLSTGVIDQVMNGLRAVMAYVQKLVSKGVLKSAHATDEFFQEVLKGSYVKKVASEAQMPDNLKLPTVEQVATSADLPAKLVDGVKAHIEDPIARKYGLDVLPMGTATERAEATSILALYKKADAWALANPVDEKRLSTLLSKFDSFDATSNQMLRSKNPVVRMVASELLENGGGAVGRRSSASIAKFMHERAIVGNTINDLDHSFKLWHKKQGGDVVSEFLTDKKKTEFNRLVAEEIEQRRYPGERTDFGDEVRGAADAMEQAFERARMLQVDNKTIGWQALPESSTGYMPHRMRADKVRSLTLDQKRALHGALTDQFIQGSGFDPTFADNLASKYLDRVNQRALGGFDAPMGLHQTGAADVVREALEAMDMPRPEIDAMMKRYASGGANHTKKRLDFDLRQTHGEGENAFRLLDLFDTNMLGLVRGQSQRVSGEVALSQHGVFGKPGLALLRRAMGYGDVSTQAAAREVEAFDQVAAEFLGTPFGVQNKFVDRALQANSVMSLGGMGFNQLGEMINVAMTLGVKSALSNVASFGRLRSEILKLSKGMKVDNPWLKDIEKFGGAEFGTDSYKLVFPYDMPDAPVHTMGADTVHFGDKLLRGAGHLQGKLSFWRAINSVQQRGVAEEIVKRVAFHLEKGTNDFHMRDMGISDDVLKRLKDDMPAIRKNGGFDLSAATDLEAANQLVQAVHRGTSQIIQGTFIGETGKYVHSSYLRGLTQFRSFSITAIDKQWNRQQGNRGLAGAAGITIAAMSAAAPIYMARTYLASIGRADQEDYLERMLSAGAIARASTNYIATAGLAGDFLDLTTSLTGSGAVTGGRSGTNTQLVGNLAAPALGKIDKLWGAVQDTKDGTDVHGFVREGFFARLPYLIPFVNSLGN